jgi:hypothetical protein
MPAIIRCLALVPFLSILLKIRSVVYVKQRWSWFLYLPVIIFRKLTAEILNEHQLF